MGVEAAYLLGSFTDNQLGGKYELKYGIIMPSLLGYYFIGGNGFNIKLGGGIGIRLVNADESLPGTGISTGYSATGVGFILRAEGNTLLSGNFYANIGGDIRYDLNGEPKNGANFLGSTPNIPPTNFNSFSAGLKLGISYFF
jgi:hypothetical protein